MKCGPITGQCGPDDGPIVTYECAIDTWSERLNRWISGDADLITRDLEDAEEWLANDIGSNDIELLGHGTHRRVIRSSFRDACGEMAYDIEDKRLFKIESAATFI